jgi:hypothetical protein
MVKPPDSASLHPDYLADQCLDARPDPNGTRGYITRPADWPYSSIHRYIRDDIIPPDWGAAIELIDGDQFGELR